MRTGPIMNLTTIEKNITRVPQAIIFDCKAMKRPDIGHKSMLLEPNTVSILCSATVMPFYIQ